MSIKIENKNVYMDGDLIGSINNHADENLLIKVTSEFKWFSADDLRKIADEIEREVKS